MKKIEKVILKGNSNEEILPAYSVKFPAISFCVNLNKYPEKGTPWHWHDTLELFYVKNGRIEHSTPENMKTPPGFKIQGCFLLIQMHL